MSSKIASISAVIVTHEMFYGAPQALRDFLIKNKIKSLNYISHPFRKEHDYTTVQRFINGKSNFSTRRKRLLFFPISFLFDYWYTFIFLINLNKQIDVYIGVDPLNCIAGLILRKILKIRKVIFYSIDFTPKRSSNQIINYIYHQIEKYCVKHANSTWNVSPMIAVGREKYLGIKRVDYFQDVVPIGVWKKEIVSDIPKYGQSTIGFVGHLLKKQGVQLVLEALPLIINKIPSCRFIIIGGGEYEKKLKIKASQMSLGSHVKFTGWIKDPNKVKKLLSACDLGVAMYDPNDSNESNFTYYADPTKLKTYLSCGLPIVLSSVPYNAKELVDEECAVISAYSKKILADTICDLLIDQKKLQKYHRNAYQLAFRYTWEKIFTQAINKILLDL